MDDDFDRRCLEVEECATGPIDHLEDLLTDSRWKDGIVLVILHPWILRLIAEKAAVRREILADRIQAHVVKILCLPTHFSPGFIFPFRQPFDLVALCQVHAYHLLSTEIFTNLIAR